MSHDRSTVEAVVKNYFDGLYEGDADKLGAIFDPTADLRWLEKGQLQVLTVPDWLARVRKRPSGKAEGDGCEFRAQRYLTDCRCEERAAARPGGRGLSASRPANLSVRTDQSPNPLGD